MKNRTKYFLCLALCICSLGIIASASTSDSIGNLYYLQQYGSMYPNFNSPYNIAEGEGDVDETTGSLRTNVEDYRFKGKNGFDVSVVRSYSSITTEGNVLQEEREKKKKVVAFFYNYYICSKDGKQIKVKFNNEAELAEADPSFEGSMYSSSDGYNVYYQLKRSDTGIFYTLSNPAQEPYTEYKETYYPEYANTINNSRSFIALGDGSRISKPSLKMYDILGDEDEDIVYLLFQDLKAQAFALKIRYYTDGPEDSLISASKAEGVSYCGISVNFVNEDDTSETVIHPRGFEYTFVLETDTGEKYYVYKGSNISYNILYAEDRYGNGYTLADISGGFSVSTDEGVTYNITSHGVESVYNGFVTELVKYEGELKLGEQDIYDKYDIDDEYILTVTKNSGTSPQISDDEENVTKYYVKRALKYEYTLAYGYLSAYKLPYKIEMPSGVTKHIEYTSIPWTVSEYFSTEVLDGFHYPVSKYYETDKLGNIKNKRTYTYTYQKGKDYIYRISEVVQKDISDDSIITTTINQNSNGQITSMEMKNDTSQSRKYTYSYVNSNSDSKISKETITHYNNYTTIGSHSKRFDYLSSYYLEEEINGDYNADYTYHTDGNYIPATITYKKDADTTVKTENILTEDKKSILTTNVYENDVLIQTVSYTYDTYGNVASETVSDGAGNLYVTNYAYTYAPDGGFTLNTTKTNIKDADGNPLSDIVTIDVYDSNYNLISHTDANGNTTSMTYDNLGRLLTTHYPDGTNENYTYDVANGITTYTAPNGTVYKTYFDAWENPIKTTVVLDNNEAVLDSYEYDNIGNVASYTRYTSDTDYVKATYTYDYLARPLTEDIYHGDILVQSARYTYTITEDVNERPITTVTKTISGDGKTYVSTKQVSNYRGFVTEVSLFTDTDSRTNTYTHDYVGNIVTATDALGNVTTTEYNGLNNPTKVTYPDGTSVTNAYNLAGLISSATDAMGNTTNFFYDNAGRLVKTTTPVDGHTTAVSKTYYDGNGNVTSQRTLSALANEYERYITVDTAYDSMGRPVTVTTYPAEDEKSVTKYAYDTMGNVTNVAYGLPSETAPLSQGHTTSYEYDALGRMIKGTSPEGKIQTSEYDLAGRLVSSTDKVNTQSTYTYDIFDNVLSVAKGEESIIYTYDLMGNRTSMTDSSGTTTYTYSPYGELTKEEKDSILKTYTYDALGRITSANVQNSEGVLTSQTYTYDNMGRLISTFNGTDTAEYTYDANSNVLTETVNGTLLKSTTYNKANLPEVITTYLPDTTETTVRTYSSDGNLRTEHKNNKDTFYYYDGANRLIYEGVFGSDISYEDFYTYDRFGNRVNKEHTDLVTGEVQNVDYVYNNLNQLIEQEDGTDTLTYTYDDNGNMLEVKKNNEIIKTYTYDAFNRLATANVNGNTAQYTYNGDNLRQTKTVNGVATHHVYDGQNIVADIGTDTNTYVYGVNLIGMRTNGSTMQTYATTPRGDVAKLMQTDGTYQEYEYDAYGNPTGDNTYTVNPFGYTGQYTDYETGLVYLRNRYYDTELGVFLTEDPIKDGSNWYVYCGGNPVLFVDPNGKSAEGILSGFLKVGGSAVALDGPLPYGDIVGAVVVGAGVVVAGGVLAYDKFISSPVSKDEEISNTIEKVETDPPTQTVIYRSASGTNQSLTPRMYKDDNGLSYFTTPPIFEKYTTTTVEAVNATGVLYAYQDPNNPKHYLIKARVDHLGWQKSRVNANESPHYLTTLLKSISIQMPANK